MTDRKLSAHGEFTPITVRASTTPSAAGPEREALYTIEPSVPADGFECWYIRDADGAEIGCINGPQSNGRQRAAARNIAAALAPRTVAESDDRALSRLCAKIIEDEIGGEVCTPEWARAAGDRIACAIMAKDCGNADRIGLNTQE